MNIQAPLNHLSYGRIHFHQGGPTKTPRISSSSPRRRLASLDATPGSRGSRGSGRSSASPGRRLELASDEMRSFGQS